MNSKYATLKRIVPGVCLALIFLAGCSSPGPLMVKSHAGIDTYQTNTSPETSIPSSPALHMAAGDDLGMQIVGHHPIILAQRQGIIELAVNQAFVAN